ncbi:hypothetical protein [Paraglaciecola sp.]|uniref:hypothetical protein n=1 Tax=Paraglaciecola sp. TaxID=1920173 RepID=UPI003265C2D4
MSLFKTSRVVLVSFACTMVTTFSSNAYYYEEHKLISQIALELAIKHKMLEINSDQLKNAIGSEFICDDVMEPEPAKCMTLADLPAIAGDHAGSPMLVQWKWLNDSRNAPWFFGVSDYLASTRIIFDKGCESSETTISKIPAREDFIEVVHKNQDATAFGETNEIINHDNNYARSAAHNCNHFRKIESLSVDDYEKSLSDSYPTKIWNTRFFLPNAIGKTIPMVKTNERVRFKPKLESDAWYAQLHATALELAARDGDNNLAAAWLFETFALHFLQDGTASGHIVTPNHGGLSVVETKKVHDKLSENGLEVTIGSACIALNTEYQELKDDLPMLTQACTKEGFETTIYGDRNLVKNQSSSPTKDLAVFLTVVSLAELGDSFKHGQSLVVLDDSQADYNDPHWTFQGQSNNRLAETLFAWWESGGSANATTTPMAEAAKKHLDEGSIKAIKLWPQAM